MPHPHTPSTHPHTAAHATGTAPLDRSLLTAAALSRLVAACGLCALLGGVMLWAVRPMI